MDSPVSICATGCVCAAGSDTESCFETMLNGHILPSFHGTVLYNQKMHSPVFSVNENWISSVECSPSYTKTARLLFKATQEALTQLGLSSDILNTLNIGTCIGSSTGASLNFKSFYQEWREGKDTDLKEIDSYLCSNPAAALADYFSLSGPVQTVTNACSSGTDALGIGASWIRQGLCDLVIAGGADELSEISYTGFSRLMITSHEPCQPFDKNRKGLNLGEGAAVLILIGEKALQKLNVTPFGKILGYGTYSDAHHLTAPHPDGQGLKKAIHHALLRSDITADNIGFINAHGTGTENNDRIEGAVINDIFTDTPFTGIKGFTGHTLGAAGAIEAVMTVMSLCKSQLMPTEGFTEADPDIIICPVQNKTKIDARYALSESLAFGGNNSAIVFERGVA
ncbi:beta-ketoacyl-[acyl-carrier-protein] synthase family protein [Maridesulfovibrio zosterae]|uniref:beta-ketoacyl-[acyl-carrier-protein] synthase family protein n=1 Tax=Maridesulfovibrio zosterae TaxID=82171 RepID=UPI0003F777EA|nr:beta-ketoacyl-[acyl-carrier-protein] synthase family protein [Maridesulfovibrio zosterae]